ncbi:hypothetical protein ACQ33O_08870 [Ferruginibacter sp. SUN002]|uniref:hypothetical protein n=1 Tax=Ferruginibacter sp. SUN002 TaxID=2937789 RepID=UPI003D36A28A
MMHIADIKKEEKHRIILTRIVFGFILLAIAYRYFNHTLLHQMQAPPLKYPSIDYTYWLVHYTGIPDLLASNKIAGLLFDASVTFSALFLFLFPLKRYFAISFTLLYFLYIICYNSYAMHHAHPMNGILILSIAFWPKKTSTFKIIWEGVRYMIIFIYADAFLWKLFSGAIFNPEQGMANIKENIGWIMLGDNIPVFNKDFYAFFLRNNSIVQVGYICTILLEGFVIIGFFTKKFDKYLFWCPIIIHVVNYFFIDVCFLETTIVSVVFLNLRAIPYLVEKLFYNLPKKMIPDQLG